MKVLGSGRVEQDGETIGTAIFSYAETGEDLPHFAGMVFGFVTATYQDVIRSFRDFAYTDSFAQLRMSVVKSRFKNDQIKVAPGFLSCVLLLIVQQLD